MFTYFMLGLNRALSLTGGRRRWRNYFRTSGAVRVHLLIHWLISCSVKSTSLYSNVFVLKHHRNHYHKMLVGNSHVSTELCRFDSVPPLPVMINHAGSQKVGTHGSLCWVFSVCKCTTSRNCQYDTRAQTFADTRKGDFWLCTLPCVLHRSW